MEENGKESVQIGELASRLGVTTRTIRYYEEIGLMNLSYRSEGSPRYYREQDILRLKFILKLKNLGISLNEMQELAVNYDLNNQNRDTIMPRLLQILEQHIKAIDAKVQSLQSLHAEIVNYRQRILNIIAS